MLLKRVEFLSTGIFGILTLDNNSQLLTLEHAYETQLDGLTGAKVWAPKLPAGVYECIRYFSPHFGYDVFMVQNVTGCSFIEIHIGNVESNSEGCVLVGTMRSGDSILNSKIAFDQLMDSLSGVDSSVLVVE